MKSLRVAVFGLLALVGQQATAQTTVTQWGVSALTAYADCTLAWCSIADLGLGMFPTTYESSGGLNATFASQINDSAAPINPFGAAGMGLGVASAQVQLNNADVGVPVLKAKAASSGIEGWVSGVAFGIQAYQYTGLGTTITLTPSLTGTIVNPDASDVTGFSVGVWLLRPDPTAPVTYPLPAPTLGGFVKSVLDSTLEVASWTRDVNDTGSWNLSEPLAITLATNDEFYLLAGLVASSFGVDQSADAFSTLTMSFNNSSNLVAASVAAVPEPETYAMMLVGVGLVGWQLRRKSKRPVAKRLE